MVGTDHIYIARLVLREIVYDVGSNILDCAVARQGNP